MEEIAPKDPQNGLKHLSFLATSSSSAYQAAAPRVEKIYSVAKAYVPSVVAPEMSKLEESVFAAAAPLAAKATDAADRLLHFADDRVCSACVRHPRIFRVLLHPWTAHCTPGGLPHQHCR